MADTNTPIKPAYPSDWSLIAARIKEAHDWTCQECGVSYGNSPGAKIGVHHLDHNTFNNDPSNLMVLCQRCHLGKEREHRSRLAEDRRLNELQASGQGVLPQFEPALFPHLGKGTCPLHSK